MSAVCAHTCVCAKSPQSCPTLCNPVDCRLPGSCVHEFSRQEYWSGLPCSLPGDPPDPGIEPTSLISPALAGGFFTTSIIWKACYMCLILSNSLWPRGLQPARLLCPWNFPGKNTGVGYHALLQKIFPTQELNPSSPALAGRFFTIWATWEAQNELFHIN